MAYGQKPRIVVEESPWGDFFASLPNTVLSFMQLQHQINQNQINRDYAASREDLKFARQEYLQTKAREDAWTDTLSKSGYSTEHITGPGVELKEGITNNIETKLLNAQSNVTQLQALSADIGKWKQRGLDWEKDFAAFEDADKDRLWEDFLLTGDLKLDEKGNVIGTGEFAEALKGLSKIELDQLKDENYRQAAMQGLRTESDAIKLFKEGAVGTAAISKIGQEKYVSDITNAINTAETYSGISNIRAIEADIAKYPDEKGVPEKQASVDYNKLNIGREYSYLITGVIPEETIETAGDLKLDEWNNIYTQMTLDLTVAKPKYAKGGYGQTMGNQKNFNETLSRVYLNYQSKVKSDPEEASMFAAKALQYFGVDLTSPSTLQDLQIEDNVETRLANEEAFSVLSSLDNLTNDPLNPAPMDSSLINQTGGLDQFKTDYYNQLSAQVGSDAVLAQHKAEFPIPDPVRLSEIYTDVYERDELAEYIESRLPNINNSLDTLDIINSAAATESDESQLANMYMQSQVLKDLGIDFASLLAEYRASEYKSKKDPGQFLLENFNDYNEWNKIEPEIIR